jgi:hypothetical protein
MALANCLLTGLMFNSAITYNIGALPVLFLFIFIPYMGLEIMDLNFNDTPRP